MQRLLSICGFVAILCLVVKSFTWLKFRMEERKRLRQLAEVLAQRINDDLKSGTSRFKSAIEVFFWLGTKWHGRVRGGYRLFGFASDEIVIELECKGSKGMFCGVPERVDYIILFFLKQRGEKKFVVSPNFDYLPAVDISNSNSTQEEEREVTHDT